MNVSLSSLRALRNKCTRCYKGPRVDKVPSYRNRAALQESGDDPILGAMRVIDQSSIR